MNTLFNYHATANYSAFDKIQYRKLYLFTLDGISTFSMRFLRNENKNLFLKQLKSAFCLL